MSRLLFREMSHKGKTLCYTMRVSEGKDLAKPEFHEVNDASSLDKRTADSVRTYFEKANRPEIKRVLPQKAKNVEEALADHEQTLLPNAESCGQTVYIDGKYAGDVWCYCMDLDDEPNCMLSFCIFERECRNKGIATAAVKIYIQRICALYHVITVGAFTFAHNRASIRVLEKNGFVVMEEFEEDGVLSNDLQLEC